MLRSLSNAARCLQASESTLFVCPQDNDQQTALICGIGNVVCCKQPAPVHVAPIPIRQYNIANEYSFSVNRISPIFRIPSQKVSFLQMSVISYGLLATKTRLYCSTCLSITISETFLESSDLLILCNCST